MVRYGYQIIREALMQWTRALDQRFPYKEKVQAAVGIVLSVVLYTALSKVPEIHKAFWKGE